MNFTHYKSFFNLYNQIKVGAIKADFWRVCILYKYGGVYSDIDIKPVSSILNKNKDNSDYHKFCYIYDNKIVLYNRYAEYVPNSGFKN